MPTLAEVKADLVAANRVLAREGVLDAFGHVSARHPSDPTRYLLSRARSPELVEEVDIVEYALDGTALTPSLGTPYLERFIHGAVYELRPEIMAVCHNHTESILPFGISKDVKLRGVIHTGAIVGTEVPVWDIADEFGDETDLLVRNMDHGRSLGKTLADRRLALMRGHGSVVTGYDLIDVVSVCIAMDKNARVQMAALSLGGIKPLRDGELAWRASHSGPNNRADGRAWEYWKLRAGSQ